MYSLAAICTVVLICAVFVLVAALHSRRRERLKHRSKSRHCPGCGYDLWATRDRCPECGRPNEGYDREFWSQR